MAKAGSSTRGLGRYVPRLAAEWDLDAPGRQWREVDGALCFVDISGFTRLSERLARFGRIGAEELTGVLDRVFGDMLGLAYQRGGGLLKFGGDALLLHFGGDDAALQACSAAVEMRAALRETVAWRTSVGLLGLRMSIGVHAGPVHVFRVGRPHLELVVTGPGATTTTLMEKTAAAGEIVVSSATVRALPPGAATLAKGDGFLLRWRKAPVPAPGPLPRRAISGVDISRHVPARLRAHLELNGAEPEHRAATIGFVRFSGVDRLLAVEGPDAVAAALDDLVGDIQDIADAEAVTFLASDIDADGGKVILAAGVPTVREDDEGRMLRTVRAIVERGTVLDVQVGVHRGHVFAGEVGSAFRCTYTVMGDTVNLAARLMAAAPAGALYATDDVLAAARTTFVTEALPPLNVKGKEKPLEAFAVGPLTGARIDEVDDGLPFVGRGDEITHLIDAIAAVARGRGGVVDVVGEMGIGKSRLLREALAAAAPAQLIELHGEAYSSAVPFGLWREPIRALLDITDDPSATRLHRRVAAIDPTLVPVLPLLGDVAHVSAGTTPEIDAIEPRFRRDRLADAVEHLLAEARPGPLVFVVEDAHWADEASAHLLAHLERAAAVRPWLLIAARRDQADGYVPAAAELLRLQPLADKHSTALVVAGTETNPLHPHETTAVVERSGGNPLYLGEILRLVKATGTTASLPDSLEGVVSAQIDGLDAHHRRLLRYASVLGRTFEQRLLDDVLAADGLVLDAASRRALDDLFEHRASQISFRHAVLRDVAYEGLSYRRRRELHRRAAEAIERGAGAETATAAGDLALHYGLAGEAAPAWRYGCLAGDNAKAGYANVEAATQYERALVAARALPDVGPVERAEVLTSLGDVREQAGFFAESLAAYQGALRIRTDPVERAELLLRRARARERNGDYRGALRDTRAGGRTLEALDNAAARSVACRLLAFEALVRVGQERPHDAIRIATRAATAAEAGGEAPALARAYLVLDWANRMLGSGEDEGVYLMRALAIYERLDDVHGQALVTNQLGTVAYFRGAWDEAVDLYTRSGTAFLRAGNTVQAAVTDANIAELLLVRGEPDRAEAIAADAARVLRAARFVDGATFAEIQVARVWMLRGELDDAERLLRTAHDDLAGIGEVGSALEAALYLSECSRRRGDAERALELVDQAVAAGGDEAVWFEPATGRVRGEALAALGRRDEAIAAVDAGIVSAQRQGLRFELDLLVRLRAELEPSSIRAEIDLRAARAADISVGADSPSG